MNRPKAVIFDLDGCLLDFSNRVYFSSTVVNQDDNLNNALLRYDKPISPIIDLWNSLDRSMIALIIITARSEKLQDKTLEWLRTYKLKPAMIFFKPSSGMQSDADYKLATITKLKEEYEILFAIDDDELICATYKANGIFTLEIKK
jgi:hypothetical protein